VYRRGDVYKIGRRPEGFCGGWTTGVSSRRGWRGIGCGSRRRTAPVEHQPQLPPRRRHKLAVVCGGKEVYLVIRRELVGASAGA